MTTLSNLRRIDAAPNFSRFAVSQPRAGYIVNAIFPKVQTETVTTDDAKKKKAAAANPPPPAPDDDSDTDGSANGANGDKPKTQ